jgi:lactoylglutathione lyase
MVPLEYKYNYTRLLVSNFKACFLFYRDVMGFEATYGSENDTYADFNTGQISIALFDKAEMSKAMSTIHLPVEYPAQDRYCLVFGVDDVDAACLQLKKQGVHLTAESTDHKEWGIRTAHFRDPDGNLIEINQPLA